MRRLTLSFCLLVAVVAAGCGGDKTAASPPPLAGKPAANKPCPNSLPFTAGYLPAGFSTQLQPGPAAGKPAVKNVTIFHYSGQKGMYLEILRGGKRGILNGAAGILLLNHRYQGSIGPTTGGNAINFRLGAARCGRYQIYSNDKDPHAKELVKVGHGLKPVSGQ
jgi:hypothetical protein